MELTWLWLGPLLAGMIALLLTGVLSPLWNKHKLLAEAAAALLIVSLPFLFLLPLATWLAAALVAVEACLLFLCARLVFGRLDAPFLRTSTVLNVGLILFVVVLTLLGAYANIDLHIATQVLAGLSMVGALVFIRQILWTYRHYKVPTLNPHKALKDLPTVSICIPARNENQALAACITAALASDYPKLEVLVLDDCSHDDTGEVIRSFAHSGVRFVKGAVPATGWLGRNQALSTLAHHATGDYLLFMSVDTLLAPDSVSMLVNYADQRAHMVSVLPYNRQRFATSTLLTTLQYFWQIALPITKRRVPVSSKCWLINAAVLAKFGGFESVKHKIVPEGSFARRLFGNDSYRFVVSDKALGITTAKSWAEQAQTSLRLLYPTFKRQPMYVLAGLLALSVLVAPFVLAFLVDTLLFGACGLLLLVAYALVLRRTHPHIWLLSTLLLPVVLTQEAILLVISMLGYEFSEINWKGRNVCYPVLRVKPRVLRGQAVQEPAPLDRSH